jgi:O-glycosyl hydrolase
MSKKLYLLIYFAMALSLVSAAFAQGPLYLDFETDNTGTEPGFTSFTIADSGTTINDITVHITGSLLARRRGNPTGIPYEMIYRDFIFGNVSPITITLSGLGSGRECLITMYSFDASSTTLRSADWTANGTYLLTTSFDNSVPPTDANSNAFTSTAHADDLGTIVLESSQNPASKPGDHFAFINALVVIPQGEYVPINYAHNPQPLSGQQDISVDAVLRWEPGENAAQQDVYLGTDNTAVTLASRASPFDVLVSQGQSSSTYDHAGLLKLNATHYWRIDEVNDPNIWKGEIWNFTTLPFFVMENFDSYLTDGQLRGIWKDNTTNGTGASVSLDTDSVTNGKSMKYEYQNSTPPYYSQTYVDIIDLGINQPDWLAIGANALVLYFRGDPNNPLSEQMYVSLTDGDAVPQTSTVMYHSMPDTTIPQWQKWNIPLTEFAGVNLSNVVRITIGFSGGSGDGVVYFDDITLDSEAELSTTASGDVDFTTVYQQLDGFGGAAVYDLPELTNNPRKEEVYDLLFKDLGLEILRIRNTYNYSTDPFNQELAATAEVVAEARESDRSPNIKTELVPWSPPAYLKSNGSEINGTLAKDLGGNFIYDDYAQWWYESLLALSALGVDVDYISIQNEPIFETGYDSCLFYPNEWWSPDIAAYNTAFETVWQKLNAEMGPDMPKMWAPESAGLWDWDLPQYISSIIDMDHVDGFSFHIYNFDYDTPDDAIPGFIDAYNNFGYKPLHMTEYVRLNTIPTFDMGLKFAWHIYNCLYYLHTTSFFNWTLFRGAYAQGGIVTLTNDAYIIRPQYWFLKGYTHFTGEGWWLLGTSVDGPGAENVRMSAFTSPDNAQLTIVILNKSKERTVITLPDYTPTNAAVYRSGQTLKWADLGPYTPVMSLPPESITTIWIDRRPTANAGPDQQVIVSGDTAQVTLDGSDSNDPIGGELTYSWTWTVDGNDYEANGVNPVIELPVGLHTIQLIVNNGLLDSQADFVDVNVITIPPIQAKLNLTPCVLNRSHHLPNIVALIELPRGIKKSDVANEPLVLYPPGSSEGIEANWQYVQSPCNWWWCCPWWYHRVKVLAFFSADELLNAVPQDGRVTLQVIGMLKSGQSFIGSDTIRIFTPPPPKPPWRRHW